MNRVATRFALTAEVILGFNGNYRGDWGVPTLLACRRRGRDGLWPVVRTKCMLGVLLQRSSHPLQQRRRQVFSIVMVMVTLTRYTQCFDVGMGGACYIASVSPRYFRPLGTFTPRRTYTSRRVTSM